MASIFGWLKSIRQRYISGPAEDRELFKHLAEQTPNSILEIGIGDLERTRKMLEFVESKVDGEIRYIGIDWFDARQNPAPEFQLKHVHQFLKEQGGTKGKATRDGVSRKVRLLPGDAFSVLARHANSLNDIDLVILGSEQDEETIERAWFFLPRMIHDQTRFLVETWVEEEDGESERAALIPLSTEEILRRSGNNVSHIRRAA